MKRSTLLSLSLSFLSLAALAGAKSATFKERLEEFRAKAELARLKAKIPDREQAVLRYPTPELRLIPAEHPIVAMPGKAVKVTAEGRVPKGALVAFDCDELKVQSAKATGKGVVAQVKAPAFAMPKTCKLHVVSPVSGADRKLPAVVLGGYAWNLTLANGMAVSLRHDAKGTFHSTWRQGDQDLGTRALRLEHHEDRSFEARVQRINDEYNSRKYAWAATEEGREQQRLTTDQRAHARRMNDECGKLQREEAQRCYARYRAESETAAARMKELIQRGNRWMGAHPIGCDRLDLAVDPAGKVTGQARQCLPDGNDYAVEGRMTPETSVFEPPPPPVLPHPQQNRTR